MPDVDDVAHDRRVRVALASRLIESSSAGTTNQKKMPLAAHVGFLHGNINQSRSEERRVGKEC